MPWSVPETLGDVLVLTALAFHLWASPYAKVEESFNLQAVHDILERGLFSIDTFDHLECPGVVPRTFLGALAISAVAWPAHVVRILLGMPLLGSQWVARGALGLLSWLAYRHFRGGVSNAFGPGVGGSLGVVFASQFHLPYYMTRTLPNTLSLMCLFIGYGAWLRAAALFNSRASGDQATPISGGYVAIGVFTGAAVLFRCDVLVLAAPAGLALLHGGIVSFWYN